MNEKRQALELDAERRDVTGKQVRHLRRDGLVPASLRPRLDCYALQLEPKRWGRSGSSPAAARCSPFIAGAAPRAARAAASSDIPSARPPHVDFYGYRMDQAVVAKWGSPRPASRPSSGA